MKRIAALMLFMSLSLPAHANLCFDNAGRDNHIDPLLLMAIGIHESRLRAGAINIANTNKTEDVCAMQVNSIHFKELEGFNITRSDLLKNPCICVYTGTWVLAKIFKQYGKNWNSVGIYNAGAGKNRAAIRKKYSDTIKSIYSILLARQILENKQATQNPTYPSNPQPLKPAQFYPQQGVK